MTKNEGSLDRGLRIVLGVAIAAFGIMTQSGIALIAAVLVAAVLAATALMGWCPIYSVLGLKTCPIDK